MNQLLAYSIITNPFPLQASAPKGSPNVAQLTIVATNNTVSDVTLQGIIVSIPVGGSSTQLTTDAKDIGPVPPSNWVLQQTSYPPGSVQFEFLPSTGYGTTRQQQLAEFYFQQYPGERPDRGRGDRCDGREQRLCSAGMSRDKNIDHKIS